MPSERVNVFVSSTTSDLGACRKAVVDVLLDNEIHPIDQDHFGLDHGTLVDFLYEKIASSDAVICLIGDVFGAAPSDCPAPPRSYTQLEYDVARELDKDIYLFLTTDEFVPDDLKSLPPEQADLQRQHRKSIEDKGYKWEPLSDEEQLCNRVRVLVPKILKEAGHRPIYFLHPPKPPSFFAGRGEELEQLRQAAGQRTPSVISVVGMGGQGKTTLVHEWLCRQKGFLFACGLWCTAYRGGFTFDMFLDEVLKYLLGDEFDKRALPKVEERIDRLLGELQRRRVLLVIDGIERWLVDGSVDNDHGDQQQRTNGRAALFDGLDHFLESVSGLSSGTHLIITSRVLPAALVDVAHSTVPMREPGVDCVLAGLSDDAAHDILRTAGLRDDDADLLTEARRYGNHPLSLIVLASLAKNEYGGWLKKLPPSISALEPDQRLHQLLNETRANIPGGAQAGLLLQILAHFIVDPSLETISAVFPGLSHVSSWKSRLLSALGRRSTTTLPSSQQERTIRKLVSKLHQWQLLQWNTEDRDRDRIHLHPIIKDYFAGCAPNSREIHLALSDWYSSLPLPDNPVSLDKIEPRRLAIEHSLAAGDLGRCATLLFGPLTRFYTFSDWLSVWGYHSHAVELLDRLIQECSHDDELTAEFLLSRSSFLHYLGFPNRAETGIGRAIDIFEQCIEQDSSSSDINLAKALNVYGNLERETGRSTDAVHRFSRAIDIIETTPQDDLQNALELARVLVNRGNALHDLARWTDALGDYDRACQILEKAVWLMPPVVVPILAWAKTNRGIALGLLQENQRALDDFASAIESLTRLIDLGRNEEVRPLADARTMLAARLIRLQRYDEALDELGLAIEPLRRLCAAGYDDAKSRLAIALLNRGHLNTLMERWPDACVDCDEAIVIYRASIEEGRPHLEGSLAHVLLIRAECRHGGGDVPGAVTDREEGRRLLKQLTLKWSDESDIKIVFLEKYLSTLTYLVESDVPETQAIASELAEEVDRILASPDASEGALLTARRVLSQVEKLMAPMKAKGIDISEIQILLEKQDR